MKRLLLTKRRVSVVAKLLGTSANALYRYVRRDHLDDWLEIRATWRRQVNARKCRRWRHKREAIRLHAGITAGTISWADLTPRQQALTRERGPDGRER